MQGAEKREPETVNNCSPKSHVSIGTEIATFRLASSPGESSLAMCRYDRRRQRSAIMSRGFELGSLGVMVGAS